MENVQNLCGHRHPSKQIDLRGQCSGNFSLGDKMKTIGIIGLIIAGIVGAIVGHLLAQFLLNL